MNSYPVHFLAHHRPLMFVGGLDPPPPPSSTIAPPSDLPPPASSPSDPELASPSSPSSSKRHPSLVTTDDPFLLLAQRLRATLTSKGQSTVWEPEGREKRKDFHVVLVDKDVRLPPAKVLPPTSSSSSTITSASTPTPRSPLSPYTPTSPLFPDGLIAPIWVRKHTDLVPSVFVLFLRLSEDTDVETNKIKDDELVKELLGRKKVLSERGIKLTVVLIASRELLDDPSLDPRLSQIRRQSSLDSRASLFVLTPVTHAELNDFVRSLQDVLYEPAVEYYQAHSKRVRRKRARLGPATTSTGGGTGGTAGRGLGKEGWIVRYEYKAGCFAEIRGELEVARKHYEECWSELSLLFHSTSTLPPRTKRWAEAKVLADCIAIKVCKLYLYHNETARALTFFRRHLKKFEELSRGWGIGEETFEFWSWVARQYRIFAELLELGVASGLVMPPPSGSRPPPSLNQPASDFLNPALILQHPGFYYEAAACCSVKRKETYQAALEAETDAANSEAGSVSGYVSTSPGFANEKKVDHSALIVELFTKAYELLKKTTGSSRVTLYIAFRISEAYHDGGQYDMALRFFDRISKTYRKERWDPISEKIRELWLDCARKQGKNEEVVRILVEMIGIGRSSTSKSTLDPPLQLLALLKETKPSSSKPLVFHASDLPSLLECSTSFWLPSAVTGQPLPFQVALSSSSRGGNIDSLPFESVRLNFADDRPPITITHSSASEPSSVQLVKLDSPSCSANLRWGKDDTVVFSGVVESSSAVDMKINTVTVVLAEGAWKIELVFDPNSDDRPSKAFGRWLTSAASNEFIPLDRPTPSVTTVLPKPHLLDIAISESSPAYLEEQFPITISIRNDDTRPLDLWIDVLVYPTEEQSSNTITIDDESSTSIVKQISFGTLQPSETASKILTLRAEGQEGDRTLDVSVQSRLSLPPSSPTSPPSPSSEDDPLTSRPTETVRTLTIPCVRPIGVTFTTQRHPPREPLRELLDLESFEEDSFDKEGEVVLTTRLDLVGDWDLAVHEVVFHVGETRTARSTFSSLDRSDSSSTFPTLWKTGDSFSIVSAFDVASASTLVVDEEDDDDLPLSNRKSSSPGWYDIAWRRSSSDSTSPLSHTLIPLPFLSAPSPSPSQQTPFDPLSCTLSVSPPSQSDQLTLLEPFLLSLTIHNLSPSSQSASLQLQVESSDSFAWAGPRQIRLPLLMAGQSKVVRMQVVGLKVGWAEVPRVRVWELKEMETDGEEEGGRGEVGTREVRVRWEGRTGEEEEGRRVFVMPPTGGA